MTMVVSLTNVFSSCLKEGVYPKILQRGQAVADPSSYRPISIIPAVAKAFKNLHLKQMIFQIGSTNTITSIQQHPVKIFLGCSSSACSSAAVCSSCCDLSKAFDVADHSELPMELRQYDANGRVLIMLLEFMSDRVQYVVGGGRKVRRTPYPNRYPARIVIEQAETYMYADDVVAVITAPNLDALTRQWLLSSVARDLAGWYRVSIDYRDYLCGKLAKVCFALNRLSQCPTTEVRACNFASMQSVIQDEYTEYIEFWGNAEHRERTFRLLRWRISIVDTQDGNICT